MFNLSLSGKDVMRVQFHQSLHFLGPGQIGSSINKDASLKHSLAGVQMTKVDGGLYITGKTEGVKWSGFVPDGNIVLLQFSAEDSQAV